MYRYACAQLGARGEGGGGDYDEKPKLVGNTTETAAIVTGLTPYTSYECTVYASTEPGEGPGDSIVGTTADDSELLNICKFNKFYCQFSSRNCQGFQSCWPATKNIQSVLEVTSD